LLAGSTRCKCLHDRFGELEEQFLSKDLGDLFSECFGCGPRHPIGLRVRCFKTEEGVLAPILVPRRYEGPRGAAHGGIVTTYLDEVLAGAAVRATDRLSVTGEITVRFVKPVPLETPLVGRGRLTARYDRYVDVEATIEELATSEVLARARGRFFFQDRSARAAPSVTEP
jgi:acyl-coenzyme A thioesterase PaaI-like protein